MTHDEMNELISRIHTEVLEIRETKGREYAGPEDTLADFFDVAKEAGTSPLQVWATYVKKHERAIDSFVRTRGRTLSESIESRVVDVIVYHYLLLGIIEDMKKAEPQL